MADLPPEPDLSDADAPPQIARCIETAGVAKAALPVVPLLTLSVLAGAFVAFGAMLSTLAMTEPGLGLGPTRILGGAAFSLGLVLVVIGGAELFTGDVLVVLAWADGRVPLRALLRNWGVAYVGNLLGAVAMAYLALWSGFMDMGGGAVGGMALKIATAEVELGFTATFVRGLLGGMLVCLAVWLCLACRDVIGKVACVVFPVAAFMALGFEHAAANMYFIPVGMLAWHVDAYARASHLLPIGADLNLFGLLRNLVPVTLGNIVGGGVFVALTYSLAYRKR